MGSVTKGPVGQHHLEAMAGDDKALFLSCYRMMTGNVLTAIEGQAFNDPAWVGQLLDHFTDYFFAALRTCEKSPESAPKAWQMAHRAAADTQVNAHINYDLVLGPMD